MSDASSTHDPSNPSNPSTSSADDTSDPSTPSITAIYIIGPSCTGKTTLCNALAARTGLRPPAYITEVARRVMRETGYTREDVGRVEMQEAIMRAQVVADREAREAVVRAVQAVMRTRSEHGDEGGGDTVDPASAYLLSDRSALDAVVYAMMKSKEDGERLIASPEFQSILPHYRNSLFVLLQPVPAFFQNPNSNPTANNGSGMNSNSNINSNLATTLATDDGIRKVETLEAARRCAAVYEDVLGRFCLSYLEIGEKCPELEERVGLMESGVRYAVENRDGPRSTRRHGELDGGGDGVGVGMRWASYDMNDKGGKEGKRKDMF